MLVKASGSIERERSTNGQDWSEELDVTVMGDVQKKGDGEYVFAQGPDVDLCVDRNGGEMDPFDWDDLTNGQKAAFEADLIDAYDRAIETIAAREAKDDSAALTEAVKEVGEEVLGLHKAGSL